MAAAVPTLPSEAVVEILTRSSLETVGRCRSISKELNQLTYESSLHQLLCERTNIVSGFFILSLRSEYSSKFVSQDTNANTTSALSLDFLEFPVKIEAANQGLLLLLVRVHQKQWYMVCKPTTKQWVKIPNPNTKYHTASTALLVLKSKPLQYKIVLFSETKETLIKRKSDWCHHLRCEIFDSTTWTWKRSNDVILPGPGYVSFQTKNNCGVAANGGLHWLLSSNQVFAFYEDAETWETFSLPPNAGKDFKLQLVEYQGRLALIHRGEESIDMWVMENYTRKLWSERRTWNINKFSEEENSVKPLAFHNGDTALLKHYHKLIFYNFLDGKSHKIEFAVEDSCRIFKFQSDREEVNLKPDET